MEIRHLKYFLAVAEELNFTKAAEKLFISQPPLSRQIKELENEIGARLFERNNKKVTLTEAGKYFENETKEILSSLQSSIIQTKKISENVNGEFKIAYIGSTFSHAISKLVQHLKSLYPQLNIKLYELTTKKQIMMLEQNEIDLGIIRSPIYSSKIVSVTWFRDCFSLVYNKLLVNNLNAKNIKNNLEEQTFISFNKNFSPIYYNALIEICAGFGFTPNVVHESNNINSMIQLVRSGLGVAIVPTSLSRTTDDFPELEFVRMGKNLYTKVLIAKPKNKGSEITDTAISYLLN